MFLEAYVVDMVVPNTPYSPGSNGLSERHNDVIAQRLQKSLEDYPSTSLHSALRHAVFAKNCWENHAGFTPYQLLIGKKTETSLVTTKKGQPSRSFWV